MYRRSEFLLAIAGVFLLIGCGPAAKEGPPPVSAYTAKFSYAPPGPKAEAPAGITLALVSPSWAVGAGPSGVAGKSKPEMDFANALAAGVQQLLVHRGFNIGGPYTSIDEMTFPQKKQSDLALRTTISVTLNTPQIAREAKQEQSLGGALLGGGPTTVVTFKVEGSCTASGFIAFEVTEPLSAQKLWLKKVDIENLEVPCSYNGAIENDAATTLRNAVAQLTEKAYAAVLDKAAAYFVREEMDLVKKQSLELREKKVY